MTGSNDDNAWRPPRAPARAPEELEGYADLVEIGRGGDSVVYRARDLAVGRDVAIKVLSVDDPARAERFVREIEITVTLGRQHPNIVTVLAVGTAASGRPAIVMDYYERGSLHDQIRDRGPLSVDEAVAASAVVADALAFAHAHGVLHRDVKPQNILVLPTSWVLADFGIARLVDTEHTASVETFTYRHASPQLLDGLAPTQADDIWSLGSTLFTLLDGRPPFASDDPDEDSALAYLRRVRTEDRRTPQPHEAQGDTAEVMAIVDRCLAKDLDQRWASAAELRDALAGVQVHGWEPGAPAVPMGAGPAPAVALAVSPSVSPSAAEPAAEPEVTGGRHAAPVEPEPAAREELAPVVTAPGEPAAEAAVPTVPAAAPAPAPAAMPAEPSPLALSVLSHGAQPADEAPTGARPPLEAGSGAPPVVGDPDRLESGDRPPLDPAQRRRRRTLLILAAAALLIGATLGLFGSVLRDDGDADDDPGTGAAAGSGPTGAPVPSATAEPTEDGPRQPELADPDLAFTFVDIKSDGITLSLEWDDPAEGEGIFVLSETLGDQVTPIRQFDAGRTEAEISYPLSEGDRACFMLSVVMPGGRFGVAEPASRCVTPKLPKG